MDVMHVMHLYLGKKVSYRLTAPASGKITLPLPTDTDVSLAVEIIIIIIIVPKVSKVVPTECEYQG